MQLPWHPLSLRYFGGMKSGFGITLNSPEFRS